MTLDDIKKKAEKDTHINPSELDVKSIQLPYITSEWLKILNEEALKLKRKDTDHKKLRGKRYHFYKTEFKVIIKSASEINEYINADEQFIESKHKLDYQIEKVEYIEGIISTLNSMSSYISNAIKWNMFKSGGA